MNNRVHGQLTQHDQRVGMLLDTLGADDMGAMLGTGPEQLDSAVDNRHQVAANLA